MITIFSCCKSIKKTNMEYGYCSQSEKQGVVLQWFLKTRIRSVFVNIPSKVLLPLRLVVDLILQYDVRCKKCLRRGEPGRRDMKVTEGEFKLHTFILFSSLEYSMYYTFSLIFYSVTIILLLYIFQILKSKVHGCKIIQYIYKNK